ncbi:MAG: AAA family ATPase [Thermoguttaceae bacterium]
MPLLEGFWIKNYRSLRQIAVGSCFPQFVYMGEEERMDTYELSPITLFVGNNGTGKSTLLDAFSFVGDCLKTDVVYACQKRGGFSALYSHDSKGPISFGFNFRLTPNARVLTYIVNIDCKPGDSPYVETELLAYREGDVNTSPLPILFLQNGEKIVRHFLTASQLNDDATRVQRLDKRHLATPILANIQKYPVIAKVRQFFESDSIWGSAAENQLALGRKVSSRMTPGPRGHNIGTLIAYLRRTYPEDFTRMLSRVATKLPKVESLAIEEFEGISGQLTVKMQYQPTVHAASEMSEGLLKLMLYLLLLEEPSPPFWTVIDEPDSSLDPVLIWVLARELADSAKLLGEQQFFIGTLSPKLADWSSSRDVWILEREGTGFTQVQRGIDSLVFENNSTPSDLWYSEYAAPTWQELVEG